MDRSTQEELLEVLEALRQQLGPSHFIMPLGSVRYHPSAVIVNGYFYPLGLVARIFADPETGHADLASPAVLVYDGILSEPAQLRYGLVPLLEHFRESKTRRSLAILALDVDGAVLEALVTAHQRRICTIAAIACPGLEREEAKHYLHSIARLCGATVLGLAVREGQLGSWAEALGHASRIVTDRRRTVIIEPARPEQAEFVAQPIGLLSVGGNNIHAVHESVEWLEGLLGH